MADVYVHNYARDTLNAPDNWSVYWRSIPALMKAGWRLLATSDGNATKRTGTSSPAIALFDPTNNNIVTFQNVGAGGTGPTLTALENATYITVTGLSGLVAPTASDPGSEGNFILFTGFASAANNGLFQIVDVISTTSCKVLNPGGVVPDANNGLVGVTWQERTVNPTYVPATWSTRAPWAVLRGGRIIRVPINTNVAGFIVGEDVTQGVTLSSQRRGKYLGQVFGATTGWLVIEPYDYATWDNTTAIIGVSSGTSLAPANITATPRTYALEIVFAKASANFFDGSVYWEHVDISGESAQLFSIIAQGADCTATSPPGFTGAAAAGSFPALGIVMAGTVKSNAPSQVGAHDRLAQSNLAGNYAPNAQILCANCLPRPVRANVLARGADSSYWLLWHSGGTINTFIHGTGIQRLDDVEPGEVSPWMSYHPNTNSLSSFNRQIGLNPNLSNTLAQANLISSPTNSNWRGYAARGSGTARDVVQAFYATAFPSSSDVFNQNVGIPARIANHPDAVAPLRRESPLYFNSGGDTFVTGGTSTKMGKGRPRYVMTVNLGGLLSSYDTLRWIATETASGSSIRGWAVGPCDGVTTIAPG